MILLKSTAKIIEDGIQAAYDKGYQAGALAMREAAAKWLEYLADMSVAERASDLRGCACRLRTIDPTTLKGE